MEPAISTSATRQRENALMLTSPSASVVPGNLEAHVVATLVEGDDLGVVPLVAEPLAVGEAAPGWSFEDCQGR